MVSGLSSPGVALGACKAALAAGVCQCCGGGAGAFRPQCVPMYRVVSGIHTGGGGGGKRGDFPPPPFENFPPLLNQHKY